MRQTTVTGKLQKAAEWEDAFYRMEQKYLQVKKEHSKKEDEWQKQKVQFRRKLSAKQASQSRASSGSDDSPYEAQGATSLRTRSANVPTGGKSPGTPLNTSTSSAQKKGRSSQEMATSPMRRGGDNFDYVPTVHSGHVPDAGNDWMMLWGSESAPSNQLQIQSLLQLNQQIRHQCEAAEDEQKNQRHENSLLKKGNETLRVQLDEITSSYYQAVRERDISVQRMEVSQSSLKMLQQQISQHDEQTEKLRFSLNSNATELRAKLSATMDDREAITTQMNLMVNEVKERNVQVVALQTKLCVTESGLISQKATNESLLLEMKNLNNQLSHERRKLLNLQRDIQVATLNQERVKELMRLVDELRNEKQSIENENVRLLDHAGRAAQIATDRATVEVKSQIDELKEAASHWERVCQLQFKDIAQRTQAHVKCREDCDEAKQQRDEAELALRALRVEVEMADAKLQLVWPTHRRDTKGLSPESVGTAFTRMKRSQKLGSHLPDTLWGTIPTKKGEPIKEGGEEGEMTEEQLEKMLDLQQHVLELQELNSILNAEIEAQRLSNELLTDKLKANESKKKDEVSVVKKELDAEMRRKKTGDHIIHRQSDRIGFLESQVTSLKGSAVDKSFSLQNLPEEETVVELFIGQMLPAAGSLISGQPSYFCTIDFLLHDTVTSSVVAGLNSFFDISFSFRIRMDNLFLYYLRHRQFVVQLHQVTDDVVGEGNDVGKSFRTIAEGTASIAYLIDESMLNSDRPMLRGHVPLLQLSDNIHIASVEFTAIVRTPYSSAFQSLCMASSIPQLPTLPTPNESLISGMERQMDNTSSLDAVEDEKQRGPYNLPKMFLDQLTSVHEVKLTIHSIKVDFQIAVVPLLSAYYVLEGSQAMTQQDAWIKPTSNIPKYETVYDDCRMFSVSSTKNLFSFLRSIWTIVLFDESAVEGEEEGQANSYWGIAMQSFGDLILSNGQLKQESFAINVCGMDGHSRGVVVASIELIQSATRQKEDEEAVEITSVLDVTGQEEGQPREEGAVKKAQKTEDESDLPVVMAARPRPPPPKPTSKEAVPLSLDAELMERQLKKD